MEFQFLDYEGLSVLVSKMQDYVEQASVAVKSYTSLMNFPTIGETEYLYVDVTNNKSYRWDDDNLKYICIGSDWEQIEVVDGGSSEE